MGARAGSTFDAGASFIVIPDAFTPSDLTTFNTRTVRKLLSDLPFGR